MSISTLILYGSRAREDSSVSSDVDLFAIGRESDYRMVVANKVNLAVYSKGASLEMSETGSLFMLHIISEGRPIYDEDSFFQTLNASFMFKPSYAIDIDNARDLGWALIQVAESSRNGSLINKRIAWCVRTIIIARAANLGKAIFSARELANFAGDKNVLALIARKDYAFVGQNELTMFRDFMSRNFGAVDSKLPTSLPEWVELFNTRRNAVGEKTMRLLLGEIIGLAYT